MQRTTIFLSEPQLQGLDRETLRMGLTRSELIRRAIDEFLKRRLQNHRDEARSKGERSE